MKHVSDKVIQKIEIHILCSTTFLENPTVYETMWKYYVKWGRSQMTIRGMGIACWIPTATNTQSGSGYVILIAFALPQCFHESASVSHYTLFIKSPLLITMHF